MQKQFVTIKELLEKTSDIYPFVKIQDNKEMANK